MSNQNTGKTVRFTRPAGTPLSADERAQLAALKTRAMRITAHTGLASANTDARNLSGNPLGVSTSTGTPSNLRSSMRIALMSNNVVSGVGSMRRSRSLLSVSWPCRTEPGHPSVTAAVQLDHLPDGGAIRGQGF